MGEYNEAIGNANKLKIEKITIEKGDYSAVDKIGLVTLYSNNYGSILQCYSTKSVLEAMGYECNVLFLIDDKNKIAKKVVALFRLMYRSLRYKGYFNHYLKMRKALRVESNLVSEEAINKMDTFVQKELMPKGFTYKELKTKVNNEFTGFIAGSDQIWNASRKIEPFFFLNFAEPYKRIALCPSFGIKDVPQYYKNSIKKGLDGFTTISVREESGKKIVANLTGKEAVRLADPTLLLNEKQWREFYGRKKYSNEKYIFMHFLGKPNSVAIESIRWLAKQMNCKVYCFANKYEECLIIEGISFVDGDAKDYVAYIDYSEAVCTDSFHSTLFAINLNKVFYTFQRQYIHDFPQTARISDLLERYKLTDRYILQFNQIKDVYGKENYNHQEILFSERKNLSNYLKCQLENVKSKKRERK